jgi:hypothetical protein
MVINNHMKKRKFKTMASVIRYICKHYQITCESVKAWHNGLCAIMADNSQLSITANNGQFKGESSITFSYDSYDGHEFTTIETSI